MKARARARFLPEFAMRLVTIAVLLSLAVAGCNTPSPRFLGAERREVTYEGVDYIVYRMDDRAQAIRLGSAVGVPADELVRGFRRAARQATGCRTHKVYTNFQVSVIDFRLLCGRGNPAPAPAPAETVSPPPSASSSPA